jgi:hypothetical protein
MLKIRARESSTSPEEQTSTSRLLGVIRYVMVELERRERLDGAMKQDWTPEERAAAEAKYKAEFTAADLQRYAEEDEVVPFEEVIHALEEKQRRLDEQKR